MPVSQTFSYSTRRGIRWMPVLLLTLLMALSGTQRAAAQSAGTDAPGSALSHQATKTGEAGGEAQPEEKRGTFDADHGTIFNPVARAIFHQGTPVESKSHYGEFTNVKYDFVIIEVLAMIGITILGIMAARGLQVRPDGKPTSLSNLVEAMVDGFRTYLIGVMGEPLTNKYAPLISSYFFTILIFNYLGMIPFLASPTTNANIPVGLAIVSFFAVHVIALREAGFKSWFMHFVGEPLWLAPLNFPLHIMGELIKPVSLAIRLLCNIFGDEMIVAQFTLMSIAVAGALHIPAIIPLQLPFLLLGVFFGFVQALVFATLVAIYIAIFATHHDDHDEHNLHGHVEETRLHGHHEIVGHPSEVTIA